MPAPTIDLDLVEDNLVDGRWQGGAGLTLSYSVPGAGAAWTGYGVGDEPSKPGYGVLNSTQTAQFVLAMELWDSFVGASFTQRADSTPGAVRVAFTTMDEDGTWGYAYLPGNSSPSGVGKAGDIWIGSENSTSTFAVGGYDFMALLHEIGHALGLDHSFQESTDAPGDGLPAEFDNYRYTVMSYTSQTDFYHPVFTQSGGTLTANYDFVVPVTPMMLDIYAIQSVYGADTATRAGDTSYTFNPAVAALQTIYDASGIDTWNLASHVRASIVDLRPGSFSSIAIYTFTQQINDWVAIYGEGYRSFITSVVNQSDNFQWMNNVAIALNTVIENVFFGSANDSAIGNDAANWLKGNSGADTLNGGAGADTLDGGAAADLMIGGDGADLFIVGSSSDVTTETSAGGGVDTVQSAVTRTLGANLENLILLGTAANATGNELANALTGNSAANTLNGLAGADTLNGGAGSDIMIGGDGNDTYVVGSGGDVTTESSSAGGVDTVQSAVSRTLGANLENLTLLGTAVANATGNELNNIITGNSAKNILTGGLGTDSFVLNTGPLNATNRDVITDFNVADDTIRMENAIFAALGPQGVLQANRFYVGAAAHDADDRLIYDPSNGALIYDTNGDVAGGAVQIATMSTGLALTNADILVI